ncbi:MAG: tail fiber protein [Chitinophagaceae bacterium]
MDIYLGELRVFGFGRIPIDWAPCNGQSLLIKDYPDLFSLLGTTYGGDGITTFNLPDLRGRAMLHFGESPYAPHPSFERGDAAGEEKVTLAVNNLAAHSHAFKAAETPGTNMLSNPGVNYLAQPEVPQLAGGYIAAFTPNISGGSTALHPNSIMPAGNTQAHENRMPYLSMLVCIALHGDFPSGQ